MSWLAQHSPQVLKLFLIQQVCAREDSRPRAQIHSPKVHLTNCVKLNKVQILEGKRVKTTPGLKFRLGEVCAVINRSAFRSSTRKQVQV